jgi:hypothetical protein
MNQELVAKMIKNYFLYNQYQKLTCGSVKIKENYFFWYNNNHNQNKVKNLSGFRKFLMKFDLKF